MRVVHSLPCLAVLVLAGCGPATGSISGKVTYKDKPLSGGKVTFLTSDQKVKTALIGPDGTYTLDQVTVGPAQIAVDPPVALPPMMPGMKMDASKMGGLGPDAATPPPDAKPVSLPPHYQNTEKSGLTYTVTTGKQEYNIPLK
jgi:hypothetical protein